MPPSVRQKITAWRWFPKSLLGRLTTYIVGLDIFLYLMRRLLRLFGPQGGTSLEGWIDFLTFIAAGLIFLVFVRWLRNDLMWRLRNRLIVTYVFMAVVPILLLVAMAAIASYIFAGQFATFIVTSDIKSELKSLEASNKAVADALAGQLGRGRQPDATSFLLAEGKQTGHQVAAWYGDKVLLSAASTMLGSPPPAFVKSVFSNLVRDHGQLYLRAVTRLPVSGGQLTVMSSEPLSASLLQHIAADLGEISLYAGNINLEEPEAPAASQKSSESGASGNSSLKVDVKGVQIGNEKVQPTNVGKVPPPTGRFDREVHFFTTLSLVDWQGNDRDSTAILVVGTRSSRLYDQLFSTLGKFASGWATLLGAIALSFILIELVALLIGIRLTRTITRSVAQLYVATQHVNRGDFGHHIEIRSRDQLAALEGSFNSMTDSIRRLLAEQKEKQRMENELAIAQEVQAQLFPKEITQLESLELHGFCRPARTVSGDYYDFLPQPPDRLTLAVGDVSGKGISAALLMATIHSAVRAYSLEALPSRGIPQAVGAHVSSSGGNLPLARGEFSPALLVGLLNQQLYRSTPAEKYATLFLSNYDGNLRRLTYTNAGHLPPVLIGHDGSVRRLDCGGTVVGLFDGLSFEESTIELHQGDLFLAFSDGITEPENDFGEFGEERLIDLVRDHRHQPLPRITEIVTAAVDDWIGGREQPDDLTLVLARAR
ncbi:MAG TPA: PP2C family protein-serine/threonine phosphatase [Terriglobales bacterium]|nr:PP2C family protein-serine/threonine phosphatase [Terriglobales bacterium]